MLAETIARFRTEFDCWREPDFNDWQLLEFVLYEGISLPIVESTAPLILGKKCVQLHGARWVMIASGDDWHFGIEHKDLPEPVDLSNFKLKKLKHDLSRKWIRLLDPVNPNR